MPSPMTEALLITKLPNGQFMVETLSCKAETAHENILRVTTDLGMKNYAHPVSAFDVIHDYFNPSPEENTPPKTP